MVDLLILVAFASTNCLNHYDFKTIEGLFVD